MTATVRIDIPADEWVLVADGLANVTIQKLSVGVVEVLVAPAAPSNSESDIGHSLWEGDQILERNGLLSTDKVFVRALPGQTGEVAVIAGAGSSSGGGGGASGDIGSATDAAAPADGTGNYGVISALKRSLLNGAALLGRIPALVSGRIPTIDAAYDSTFGKLVVGNARGKVRDGFDTFDVINVWDLITQGSGDLISVDGNAAAASYVKIIKNPLNAGTETVLLSQKTFKMPVRIAAGISLSQRIAGQEFYLDFVGVDENGAMISAADETPVVVTSVTTASTVWTVNTAAPHGYVVGDPAHLYGFSDSRFNFASIANAAITGIPTPTSYTINATNLSNASAGAGMCLRVRPTGAAMEAAGYRWSGVTANNANPYSRSGSNSSYLGNEVAFGTSASFVPPGYNVANTFAHQATTSFELTGQMESLGWAAIAVDQTTPPVVAKRMQAIPDIERNYKLRFRARNLPNLTVPVGKIVSSTKTGTTTATHNIPAHGLTTGDQVVIYGVRDQAAASFPNVTTATAITVVDANNIQIVQGSAGTVTSAGGYIARVQGGVTAFGAISQVVQSISRANGQMTIVGNAAWSGLVVGEDILLYGLDGSGAPYEGIYKVANISTTNLVVDAPGADFGTINCGGGVIKATAYRLHYARAMDYTRHLTEVVGGYNRRDANNAVPVVMQPGSDPLSVSITGTPAVAQSGTWTVAQGAVAALGVNNAGSWPVRQASVRTTDVASAAITTTQTSAAIDVSSNNGAQQFTLDVTAVSGTTPRCYFRMQESFDGGVNFVTVFDLPPAINATDKSHATPVLPVLGTHCRYVRTLSGTTPSFTNSVTRTERTGETAKTRRQLVDRVVSLLATTASTDFLYIDGCMKGQLVLALAAATTAPTLKLQVCDDISNGAWYDVPGATVAGTANATVASAIFDLPPAKFARLVPTVVGTGITADTYTLMVKAWS